jgi:hypothetical protein
MKVAVMQPYLFPYIGYYQLIKEVDHFVFYDDVNFIKGGWINRNNILIQGKGMLFTVPLKSASYTSLIKDVQLGEVEKFKNKFLKTIEQSYKKAPYFNEIAKLLEETFSGGANTIGELSAKSIVNVCNYLGLNKNFYFSSIDFANTKTGDRSDRLIEITKTLNCDTYINSINGMKLYDSSYFSQQGIQLQFIKPQLETYTQFEYDFVPGLSIIDVLMFNSVPETLNLLTKYELV